MIRDIAYKEFLQMVRDGRVQWAAGILIALLLIALAVGWRNYEEVSSSRSLAQNTVYEQWLQQPEQNPHSGVHYSTYAFRPRTFLSSLDPGLEPYVGATVWLEAHLQNQVEARPADDASAVQRFGQMTVAMVLQVLLPLLIILVAFSVFAGEREQGTLRMLLSLGVQPSTLAAGKALGVAGALALVLVPAVVIGVLTLSLLTDLAAARLDLGRMLLMTIFYLLYLGIFVGVSLAVSARARSSRLALIGLLGFWFFNSLIAPHVTSDIARTLYPNISNFEFEAEMAKAVEYGLDGTSTYDERRSKRQKEVIQQYGVEKLRDLPVNFYGIQLQMNEDWGYEIFDKFYGDLYENFRRQNRVRDIASIFAPLLAIRPLSMGLSATDWYQHQDFVERAEMHRRLEVKIINHDITFNGIVDGISLSNDYVNGIDVWEKVPPFEYRLKPVSWVLGNHRLSIVILLLWFAFGAVVLCWVTGRIEVE
jgi:ABC-2 type transport system permease protein